MEPERLQKVLARMGLASRREAEEWIRAGRITVNGQVATLGVRVKPTDQLRLDGRPIRQRTPGGNSTPQVFIVHRSPGQSLTPQESGSRPDDAFEDDRPARSDVAQPKAGRARPEIHRQLTDEGARTNTALIERLPRRAGRRFIAISPMPRIDGGLELVTSDGELAAQLQRAAHRFASEFSVRIRGELTEAQREAVLDGLLDRGTRLQVEKCEPTGESEAANRWYAVIARGGSGKDVRQLFERQGVIVSRILRTRMGPLALSRDLTRGHFRRLEPKELEALMTSVRGDSPASSATKPSDNRKRLARRRR